MQISEINIYPIKSLKGISLSDSVVEKRGLRFDRRWMLTDPDGMFFTQREVPKMAAVTVKVLNGALGVSAEGFEALEIPFEPDHGERETVTVWDTTLVGETYLGPMKEWFSEVLSKKCKLVRMPDNAERHVNEKFDLGKDTVSFADGYPLLLIGEASLEDLNERLARNAEDGDRSVPAPLPMNRFRPNVVVKGSEAFEEDRWARIKIGEVFFRVVKPCARCVITTVDQLTGEFDGKEPLKTLATYRLAKQVHPETFESFGHGPNGVLFGENLIPENPGTAIRVGDAVEILERRKV